MEKIKLIKLFRLLFYILANSSFFTGAVIRMFEDYSFITAYLYIASACFYISGVSVDVYLFIKED